MTRRLILALVAVVVATLVVVATGTIVVANARARATTERELSADAARIVTALDDFVDPRLTESDVVTTRRLRLVAGLRDVLQLDELALVVVRPNGTVVAEPLPAGLNPDDLVAGLGADGSASGTEGNQVWAAAATTVGTDLRVAVVLAREANPGFGPSLRWFGAASIATVILGVGAAVLLGRRLGRPVREAANVAHEIARGNLDARVSARVATSDDELGELARSVDEMAASLQRSRALEQQFLLSVSHDLRTPLTSIRGYAEAIEDGAGDPVAAATVIVTESQRLERLVNDLLDLARLQSASFRLELRDVDLDEVAASATTGLQASAASRGVHLRHERADQSLPVRADPDRLAQVVGNLVENALRHAHSTVVVRTTGDGSGAVLVVDDDGPGIAPTDLPHVFERLYVARSQPRREESPSGLGLAIVHELVAAHGGTVTAGEAPRGGARFTVRLPGA